VWNNPNVAFQTSLVSRAACSTVLVALALTIAACRGASSDGQPTASETDAPPSSGPISVEWTDVDLEKNASRNGYGSKPDGILSRSAEGTLVFAPETAQDHIATPFTGLDAFDGDRSLELSVDTSTAGGESCVANLQDQAFNVLGTVPCRTAGEQHATVKVPAGVTGVRVYFLSASREPIRLPSRMRLTEHR
jgi:hypothetical protein